MHETVIAKRIIEDAERQGEVKKLVLEVGELAHISKDELEPTLRDMVAWELDLSEEKAECQCDCGYEGVPKVLERGHDVCLYECPRCGNVPELTKGADIRIVSVEV